MSETIDVNVLVYAQDSASELGRACRRVLEGLSNGPGLAYLLWPTLISYVRLITNPSLFPGAISHASAVADVELLLGRPNLRVVGPGEGFWRAYRRATDGPAMTAKLVADAQLVAIMYEHGIGTIWTRDRDLRKFDGIRVRDPLKP